MQLDTLLIFLFSASILTLSPGPDIIYVFLKSSTDGKIAGIKTVLGLTTGLFFHTILLVFGISALINSNEYFFMLIKVFGFMYFIFLAISTYNENSKINENKLSHCKQWKTSLWPKTCMLQSAPNRVLHAPCKEIRGTQQLTSNNEETVKEKKVKLASSQFDKAMSLKCPWNQSGKQN